MSPPLDVAVNMLWCVPGRVGGSEEYLTRQLAGLAAIDPDETEIALTVFATATYGAVHRDDVAGRHVLTRLPLQRRPVRIAAEHTWLAARSRAADLVHHAGGTAPRWGSSPYVVTIHDLQYLEYPQYFSAARLRYLRTVVPPSVRRARRVAVPSAFVASTVVDAFGIDPDRIGVVPHGIDVATAVDRRSTAAMAEVLERHRLAGRPYVVYPAITHPHKNHAILVDALEHLDDDVVLVLLGGSGGADAQLGAHIARSRVSDRIVRPGRVPDTERDLLVAGAEALVFPSRYEGFGAPLIEAMALGTPVITSTHAALVEVGGDATITVDPDDAGAWATAITEAGRRRVELVAAGRRRVDRYTLEISGRALLDTYRRAVA